ncbi:MAG: nitroreductase [Candidatus Hodarchaeota archaeon]
MTIETMLLVNIILHGFIYAFIVTAYLLFIMIKFGPRIWAYSDYPKAIKDAVPPQTKKEKKIAAILGLPFFIITLSIPFISTLILKTQLGGEISLLFAFLNTFGVAIFANIADLVILDWLIVGTITPQFVILPGTEHMKNKEYKDFKCSHVKGHITVGIPITAILSLIIAIIVVIL